MRYFFFVYVCFFLVVLFRSILRVIEKKIVFSLFVHGPLKDGIQFSRFSLVSHTSNGRFLVNGLKIFWELEVERKS